MLNKHLTEQTWAKKASALNDSHKEVHWSSENAAKRDITSWIYYLFNYQHERDVAIKKLKSVINADPVLMGVYVDKWDYEIPDEKEDVPLWCWNDEASWEQVSRLMALVTL